jgi:hypothetical protein
MRKFTYVFLMFCGIASLVVIITLGFFVFVVEPVAPPRPPEVKVEAKSIEALSKDTFELGVMLGYYAATRGASKEDISFLIGAANRNDFAACAKWFEERERK